MTWCRGKAGSRYHVSKYRVEPIKLFHSNCYDKTHLFIFVFFTRKTFTVNLKDICFLMEVKYKWYLRWNTFELFWTAKWTEIATWIQSLYGLHKSLAMQTSLRLFIMGTQLSDPETAIHAYRSCADIAPLVHICYLRLNFRRLNQAALWNLFIY